MLIKLLVVIIGLSAIILTFRSEMILRKFFKIVEPTEKQILGTKFFALTVAGVLFSVVLIFN